MKVLDFIIVGQTIQRDTECDFSGLVAGSRGKSRPFVLVPARIEK